ncbi:MAG: hypothetical protein ACE5FN_12505 [Leptospirillia bacterium]
MKPATNTIQIKRHYVPMSPEQADEVVNTVADLIVSYLEIHGVPAEPQERKEDTTHE